MKKLKGKANRQVTPFMTDKSLKFTQFCDSTQYSNFDKDLSFPAFKAYKK